MGLVIPQHHGGIRQALDAAADRAIDQALRRPLRWIAGALGTGIALIWLGRTARPRRQEH